jgi:hypothetical protein
MTASRARARAAARLLGSCAAIVASWWAPPALAEESPKIVAEQLFTEAHALLEQGDVALACKKLEQSERLDPAGGTALLLGICLEHEGELASAWAAFHSARALAARDGRRDRIDVADAHLREIEPRVPHVTVTVAPAARVPGLVVTLDGVALDDAARDTPIPVDPGPHEVRAAAPGRSPVVTAVSVPQTSRFTVEPLPLESSSERPAAARTIALIAAGTLGAAAAGVTLYFGVGAMVAEERKPLSCSTADAWCVSQARSLEQQRTTDATIATIAGAATAASAVSVAALLLFSPRSRPRQTGWVVTSFGTAGVAVGGRF